MLQLNNKESIKNFVLVWAKKYNYLDNNGLLTNCVDYDIGYDMKSDILNNVKITGDIADEWFDLFLETTLLPILRELVAVNED